MKKAIILITALVAVTLISTQAFSRGYGQGDFGGGRGLNRAVWNDLSQEQRDEIAALRQQFIDDTYELRSTVMLKKHQARMLMETSNPSKADLLKLSDEVTELMNQIHEKRIDLMLAVKKIAPELRLDGPGMGFGQGGGKGGQGKGGCRMQTDCPGQGQGQGMGQGRGCGQNF